MKSSLLDLNSDVISSAGDEYGFRHLARLISASSDELRFSETLVNEITRLINRAAIEPFEGSPTGLPSFRAIARNSARSV